MSYLNENSTTPLLKQFFRKGGLRKVFNQSLARFGILNLLEREDVLLEDDNASFRVYRFGRSSQINSVAPILPLSVKSPFHSGSYQYHLEQPFVLNFSNARLVGPFATGVDSTGRIILETTLPYTDNGRIPFESIPLRFHLDKFYPDSQNTLAYACSLVNCWGNDVYHHWILDCLTRLEGAEKFQEITGIKPKIIVHKNCKKWQLESLSLLGYQPEDLVYWEGQSTNVKNLIVPSFRRQSRWTEISSIEWLRHRLSGSINKKKCSNLNIHPERIYVSRNKNSGRGVHNEKELVDLLEKYGFYCCSPETLKFSDEVCLFSKTKVLIGVHGSGLSNILFSNQSSATVIDLFHPDYYTQSVFRLSASLGFEYLGMPCKPSMRTYKSSMDSVYVDLDALQIILEKMNLMQRVS